MRKIDFSKTIGLVRYLDGSFRPSNSCSAIKLDTLLKLAGIWSFGLSKNSLRSLKYIAAEHGYKIMFAQKALREVCHGNH